MEKEQSLPEPEGANIRAALRDDPVQMYLNDIGTIDLLDVHQEFWLGARLLSTRRSSALQLLCIVAWLELVNLKQDMKLNLLEIDQSNNQFVTAVLQ